MNYPSDWHNTDFYLLLGVDADATAESIKAEYLWNAKKFHPDLNDGDKRASDRFQKIQRAYEVLSDPATRLRYDEFLATKRRANGGGDFSSPPKRQERAETSPSGIPSEAMPTRSGAGVVVFGVFFGLVAIVVAASVYGNSASQGDMADPVVVESTPTPPPPPAQAPVASKYSPNDVQACKDFRDFNHLEEYETPTNADEQRWVFNQLSLDYSGFFYLADDYELQLLSDDLSRKAGIVAQMADIGDESIWGMVTTGFQDSYNKLWAVCGEVR